MCDQTFCCAFLHIILLLTEERNWNATIINKHHIHTVTSFYWFPVMNIENKQEYKAEKANSCGLAQWWEKPSTLHSVKAGRPPLDQHQPLKTWQLETWRICKAYIWIFKITNLQHVTVSRNEKGKWQFFYLAFLSTDHNIRQSKLHHHIRNRHIINITNTTQSAGFIKTPLFLFTTIHYTVKINSKSCISSV